MALTDEQILQQINVLTTRTSDNSSMVYKTNGTLNKGLNPSFFTGNETKIVNAINKIADANSITDTLVKNISDAVNNVLLDTSSMEGAAIWESVKQSMEADTIIEGIDAILSGKLQDKILKFTVADAGKILTVQTDEKGEAITVPKSIEDIINLSANNIAYSHNEISSVDNIKEALDYLIEKQKQTEDNAIVEWEEIQNKPEIGNGLELINDKLTLKNDEGEVISEIELVTDEDIANLLK